MDCEYDNIPSRRRKSSVRERKESRQCKSRNDVCKKVCSRKLWKWSLQGREEGGGRKPEQENQALTFMT